MRFVAAFLALVIAAFSQTVLVPEEAGHNVPVTWGQVFSRGEMISDPVPVAEADALGAVQANVINRWPDGSVRLAFCAAVIRNAVPGQRIVVEFAGSDIPQAINKTPLIPDEDAGVSFTWADGREATVRARDLLALGAARVIHEGAVVTILEIGDHSVQRLGDVGPDEHRSLRPFWQVWLFHTAGGIRVRWVVENCNSETLQDVGPYAVTVWTQATGGERRVVHSQPDYTHLAMTRWTWTTNIGTPIPPVTVQIDAEHIARAGVLPRFGRQAIQAEITEWVTGFPVGTPIGERGKWIPAGSSGGGKPQLGPIPEWDAVALLSGSRLATEAACRAADLGGRWPLYVREGRAGAAFQGQPLSTSDRPTLKLGTWTYAYTRPADRITPVGTMVRGAWGVDRAHLPNMHAVPAILTGDPYYAESAVFVASWGTAVDNGAATTLNYGRGPTGTEGNIATELRGEGWGLLQRISAWTVAPEGPWEARLSELILDDLAAEEAERAERMAPGSPLESRPVYGWQRTRPYDYRIMIGRGRGLPPANDIYEGLSAYARTVNGVNEALVELAGPPWQMSFVAHAWHRAAALGFPAERLLAFAAHNTRIQLGHPALGPDRLHAYVRPLVGINGQWMAPEAQIQAWTEGGRGGNYIDYATPGIVAAEWASRRGLLSLATCPMAASVPDVEAWAVWLPVRSSLSGDINWAIVP